MKTTAALASIFCILFQLHGSPVIISFLDNDPAINQTADFLTSQGCDKMSVDSFRRVLSWYNSTPTDLNLAKFPNRKDGFYCFNSVTNLINTLGRRLYDVNHQPQLDCFDTAFLLAENFIKFNHGPDDLTGPFLMPYTTTNSGIALRIAATPRDAFNLACPAWWVDVSKGLFADAAQSKRMTFFAAFDSFSFFPQKTKVEGLADALMEIYQLFWKRCGVIFPSKVKIVIFYSVSTRSFNSLSAHAGLLFEENKKFTFLEKTSPTGPYVRLDFVNINDLFEWYKSVVRPSTDKGNLVFATFNDQKIYNLGD